MIESQAVGHLLTQVRQVVHNHEKMLRTTGNGFSFTHALNIESDEARFHTKFIGYLLNPKAGHYQGDKFLKLFFEALKIRGSTEGFTVEMEKYIGKVDLEKATGGIIDLLISNQLKKVAFAIEVKIYALEQPKQLERYSNYLKANFSTEESNVFYLTLQGTKSLEEVNFENYSKISFSEKILKWIENCRLVSIDQPLIRETLTQYIANIKRLTNQNPDDQMSNEIINLITNSDSNFKAFEAITSVQSGLYQRFGENLVDTLRKIPNLEKEFRIEFNNRIIPNRDAEISFYLRDSQDLRIRLYWLGNQVIGIGLHCGFVPENKLRLKMRDKLSSLQKANYLDFPNWIWLSEIVELQGEPQLTFESWQKFQSLEFAQKVAGWVKQIAEAYREVVGQESSIS